MPDKEIPVKLLSVNIISELNAMMSNNFSVSYFDTSLPVSSIVFHCCDISCPFADCNQTHFCSVFRKGTPDSYQHQSLLSSKCAVFTCIEMSGPEHNTALCLEESINPLNCLLLKTLNDSESRIYGFRQVCTPTSPTC